MTRVPRPGGFSTFLRGPRIIAPIPLDGALAAAPGHARHPASGSTSHPAPARGRHAAPVSGHHAPPASTHHAPPARGRHAAPAGTRHTPLASGRQATPARARHRHAAPPRVGHGWISFGIVSVAVYVSLLDTFIVNLAFPAIGASFPGTSLENLSWVFTGYAIVFAGLLVPAGRIADAVGRKRMFLIGLGVFVLASGLCAAAVSPELLIFARILQGAGAALFTPSSLAVVLPEFPPEKRAAVFGAFAAVGGVGAASGPLLGSVLVQSDWRLIFLVNIPVGLASLLAGAKWLRESRDEAGWRQPDLVGTAALIVGVSALAFTIGRAGEPVSAFTGAVAFVLLVCVAERSRLHHTPALDVDLLRRRTFLTAVSAALLFGVGFAATILAGAQFLTLHWDQSILVTGLEMSPGPIMAAAVAIPAARKLAPRFGLARVGAAGGLLAATGSLWLFAIVSTEPAYVTSFLPAQILSGAGVGLAIPSFSAVALSAVEPARLSTAVGISSTFQQIGSALGAAAFISIVGSPFGAGVLPAFERGWLFIAAVQVLAATVMLLAAKRQR